ncbi:hypothetical protein UPYG_G00276090 [Umbra pygmaea]|uniref:Syndecan/Neurexin domain-containing protein n=1 Tax=Umbra pygmaea TaxID=75934 RepID=A0ABD0WN02_UMBPY
MFTLLVFTGSCLPNLVLSQYSIPPEDLDGSGNDLESSGSGDWAEGEDKAVLENTRKRVEDDSHLISDTWSKLGDDSESANGKVAKSQSLLGNKETIAAIIGGGVVGLALAVSLTVLIYNMKKNDWVDTSNRGYLKPKTKKEFLV